MRLPFYLGHLGGGVLEVARPVQGQGGVPGAQSLADLVTDLLELPLRLHRVLGGLAPTPQPHPRLAPSL